MKRLRFSKKMTPSPLWRRFVAYIIDVLILDFFVAAPFQKFFTDLVPEDASFRELIRYFMEGNFDVSSLLVATVSLMAITVLYWALLEWKLGQSLGKMVVNVFVQTTRKKEMLNFNQCLLRNLSKVSTLLLFFDVTYMLFRKTHQRWLEEKSNTEVVQKVERVII